jgi:hypothetical protein
MIDLRDSITAKAVRRWLSPRRMTTRRDGSGRILCESRNGAGLFFRNVDGGVQIVGKAGKGNESAVIRRLTELDGQ